MAELSNILLDSASGELEILEFTINGVHFGVNVSKVSEIVIDKHITGIPLAQKGIAGMFNIRDHIYTVYDLNSILFDKYTEFSDKTYFILCNFNNLNTAFAVDTICNIKRCAWSDIVKPSVVFSGDEKCSITGIVRYEDDLVSLLDFEALVSGFNQDMALITENILTEGEILERREEHTLLIADDSKMLNKMITDTILKAGYKVVSVEDGKQLVDIYKASPSTYSMIITDIEMPVMDGLEASKLLKEEYPDLPIVVFSSLVNDALKRKVEKLHLNALISKPELPKILELCDSIVLR